MEVRQKKGKYYLTFFVPSSNLSETIEPETGVTAETTAQEFIEGQQSNVYNEFWEMDLQSTSFVLDIVDSGYRLPFKDTIPSKCFLKNNKSALKNSDFVKTAIKHSFYQKGELKSAPLHHFV